MNSSTKAKWYHHPWYKKTAYEVRSFGDWGFRKEFPFSAVDIPIESCLPYLTDENLITVQFEDIAWKGKHLYPHHSFDNCPCCFGARKDPELYPGIISDISNPYNDKYRMLDGKHRMAKMISMGLTESQFYFIPFSVLKRHFISV